jgi:predicted TIM-barrel fold metal-dependent hydrolase
VVGLREIQIPAGVGLQTLADRPSLCDKGSIVPPKLNRGAMTMDDGSRLTRRKVLASLAATTTLGLASRQLDAAMVRAGGPYLDIHTHLGRTWNGDQALTADGLLSWMDDHNVARAVLLPLVSPESSSYPFSNDAALDAARAHPDRFIPFCCIDPRTSYRGGRAGLRAMLKESVDRGVKGFGEHKAGLAIDEPRMMALYEVCDDHKLPVLFHMDDLRGMDTPGCPGLERVLKGFPAVNFIGHGPGFWASISGDLADGQFGSYPKTKVAAGGALDRLLDVYPNLWGDLSAGSGANALARDRDFGRAFLERRSGRLMFGTDYLKPGQDVPQFDLLASFDLKAETRARIERGNASKLLGL